jgi:2-hydroxy-3-keto-5-methylthiopentenyl-1-phosphate phosphatase
MNHTPASQSLPTLIQCDFDGTVTFEDASFLMLDTFAGGDWRQINRIYEAGGMTVGRFNDEAFRLGRATREDLLRSIDGRVRVRPGFRHFVSFCRRAGFRLAIVSNGLDFYIEDILEREGLSDVEVHAARTRFRGDSLSVQYHGPDGRPIDDAFKASFVEHFLANGYRMVYVGDGSSDFVPAQRCERIFATGTLLRKCVESGVAHCQFDDFSEIERALQSEGQPE